MTWTIAIAFLAAAMLGFTIGMQTEHKRKKNEHKRLTDSLEATQRENIELNTRLQVERETAEQLRHTGQAALKAELQNIMQETARIQSESLRTTNREQLETLLGPLGKELHLFKESLTAGHASLDTHIKHLMDRTLEIGKEAGELARALKADSKKQGNWGEAVLANLLEASGLRKGHDFEVQATETDEQGRRLIPDVVIHFPGQRRVIIDSKVSLTAYTQYATATNENDRRRYLKEHVASVRKHVKELSEKSYDRVVPGAIGYVLMFIPHEAGYLAAVETDPQLSTDAYARHIILLNPANLLATLQLAYNLWQSERQSQSVEEIYQSADRLYTKFVTFARTFEGIGNGIRQLSDAYERAEKQLCTGKGNIVRQLENWRKKGMNTSAQMPERLLDQTEE